MFDSCFVWLSAGTGTDLCKVAVAWVVVVVEKVPLLLMLLKSLSLLPLLFMLLVLLNFNLLFLNLLLLCHVFLL